MSPEKMPACLRCGQSMQEGLMFGSAGPSSWIAGRLERRRWIGGLKLTKERPGQKPLLVKAFRCPRCGYLECYAPPA